MSPLHEALVAAVHARFGTRSAGFAQFVDSLNLDCSARGIRPDAFRVNEDASELEVYEIEVGHPISLDLHKRYGQLWFALDSYGWTLWVFAVDATGAIRRLDLARWFVFSLRDGEPIDEVAPESFEELMGGRL